MKDRRSQWWSVGLVLVGGVGYGLTMRGLFGGARNEFLEQNLLQLSFGFVFLVPGAIGYWVCHGARRPTFLYRWLVPWTVVTLSAGIALAIGWEGLICTAIALPAMLLSSSIGAALEAWVRRGVDRRSAPRTYALIVVLTLPLVWAPLEAMRTPPERLQVSVVERTVAAPPQAVWRQVRSVSWIEERERGSALFLRLGFPHPLEAELTGTGVGAVRHARFEGDLVFEETITDWWPGRRLAFSIDADPETIPETTLDPHVTVGGETFDVLEGWYEIEPLPGGRSHVRLGSRYRLATPVNVYAGPWADAVMASIQRYILEIVCRRAEESPS